jgi:hypothetical protein
MELPILAVVAVVEELFLLLLETVNLVALVL